MPESAVPPSDAPRTIPPSPAFVGRMLSGTSIVVGTLALVALLWITREVFLLVFAGLLFAVLLRAGAAVLCRFTPLGNRIAVLIVLLVLVSALAVMLWTVGPNVAAELRELRSGLTQSVQQLRQTVERTTVGEFVIENTPQLNEDNAQQLWTRIGGISATALGAFGALTVVVFVGIFFAFSPGLYVSGLLRLMPVPRRRRMLAVIDELGGTLRWWMVSQLISMIVLWLSTWLALWLLGVPLAFILGLLTGLLTFIPYLGPLIAAIPIALVALMESPTLAMTALGVYLVIQNIEANLLMPLVYQRLVHIPPALTIASQILMGTLVGVLGVVLATPLLAVLLVIVQRLYVEDVLGDSMERPAVDADVDGECASGDDAAPAGQ